MCLLSAEYGGRPYTCANVRPASMQRIAHQLRVEATEIGAEGLTCWEWHMYASPLTPGRPCHIYVDLIGIINYSLISLATKMKKIICIFSWALQLAVALSADELPRRPNPLPGPSLDDT